MLDVVGNTEPGGFGGINGLLAQLRGETPNFGGGVDCVGDVCQPVDQFGNPVDQAVESRRRATGGRASRSRSSPSPRC